MGEPLRGAGPFESTVVVIAQTERPFFEGWKALLAGPGPLLVLSTAEDTPLGAVKPIPKSRPGLPRDDYALVGPEGSLLLQIEVDDVLPSLGKVRFRFTDASGDEVGTAVTRWFLRSRELHLRTAEGRHLCLSRAGANREWLMADSAREQDRREAPVGRVTVSTMKSWSGRQRYVVETGPELELTERRGVVASAVCLHLLRRVLAGGTSPA
ncbi:hypothetical protein ACWELO_34610 [Streptomyces sp. NPDC004596]